jgi:hypothetical protein
VVGDVEDSSTRIDHPSGRFAANRSPSLDSEIDEGYLDQKCRLVCGSGTFCALGLPDWASFPTVEEAKRICEQDADDPKPFVKVTHG